MTNPGGRTKRKPAAKKAPKKALARKTSARRVKAQDKPKLVLVEPLIVELYDLDLDRVFSESKDKGDEIESSSYGCQIHPVVHTDGSIGGQCRCSVEITYTSGTNFEISATYFFLTKEIPKYLEAEAEIVLQQIGKTIVWPRFETLFAFLNNQAGVLLPKLPITPQVKTSDEFENISNINELTEIKL